MYKYSTTNYLKSLLCQKHNWIENKTLTVASSWPMVMDWTPQSPDLNIIEAVRVILREHPKKSFDYPSRSLENHSWGTLKEMTESESCSVCQLPERVQAVKNNKGVHTKYSLSSLIELYKLCICLMYWNSMYVCTYFNQSRHLFLIFLAKYMPQEFCTTLYIASLITEK